MRLLALVGIVGACGFSPRAIGVGASNPDGQGDDAPAIDAEVLRPLYASSDMHLYAVDVDLHRATLIGTITAGSTAVSMNALAFLGNSVIGIPTTGDALVQIDPATAQVTQSVPLSVTHTYWGLTVGNGTIYAATNATTSNFYRIALDGTVTMIGTFGNSMSVAGDLAWVNNTMYVTLEGGNCSSQCLATVDLATGHATLITTAVGGDLWALSGYRGKLWALRGSGEIDRVDPTTGALTMVFTDASINWWEGAE
jgi:hypothetical protein